MSYLVTFVEYLNVDRNLSPLTISNYKRDVEKFLSFCDKGVNEVTHSDIRSYLSHLSSKKVSRNSMNRYICSLKSFFNYLVEIEKVVSESPAKSIKLAKREKSLPKNISLPTIKKLLTTASAMSLKHRLVLELFYGLGGRVSEIASIKLEDIDFEDKFIRILGKGNKERVNPIHDTCVELLISYIDKYNISEGYIFPHRLDPARHATREGLFLMVKTIASKAGVDPVLVSPHVFRHSYAQHLLDNGCELAMVQELLGHEDISTTKIYARASTKNKTDRFKAFHPLGN